MGDGENVDAHAAFHDAGCKERDEKVQLFPSLDFSDQCDGELQRLNTKMSTQRTHPLFLQW